MSIQTQDNVMEFEGNSSFLDKSEIQVQTEKTKMDAACQYDENLDGKKNSMLPPSQKRAPSLGRQNLSQCPSKSIICSIPTSKNSTIRTPQNGHFQHFASQQQNVLDELYLQMDDDSSIQHHNQQSIAANSYGTGSDGKICVITNQQPSYLQPSLMSPFYHNNPSGGLAINFDHFKSQCSEVIIRGSSETDISNKIAKAAKIFINSSEHHHSHQISGCQSIANLDQHKNRSQFTSIETGNYSPQKNSLKPQSIQQLNSQQQMIDSQHHESINQALLSQKQAHQQCNSTSIATDCQEISCNIDQPLHTGDTFMKTHQRSSNYYNPQLIQTDDDYLSEGQFINNVVVDTQDSRQYQTSDPNYVQTQSNVDQTDEEFNYTIRLNDIKDSQSQQQQQLQNHLQQNQGRKASLPPIYQHKTQNQNQQQQSFHNPYLNNTSSTAGFPQHFGYQVSQQTARKSSITSSFNSQINNQLISQPSFQSSSRSNIDQEMNQKPGSKKSFLEKIVLIQANVRGFLQRLKYNEIQQLIQIQRTQNQDQREAMFNDSTINKPVEESLSNISAQLLNSLKQHLNTSSNMRIRPNEQSYQKNILESLNLTTGNTFVRETKHFGQGKDRTQFLGNSSALVLYSGSTHDNRIQITNNFQPMETASNRKQMNDYDPQAYLMSNGQQSPTNNTSLLNMTEESNSAFFKLTPIASQNVTQKTLYNPNNVTNQIQQERTTESNNLNYSYSEIDSEWCNNLQKDCSPHSVNTTSSKIRAINGNRSGQRITGVQGSVLLQRSGSIQSEQIAPINNSALIRSKYTQKIKIEECVQSPLSLANQGITSTRSAAIMPTKKPNNQMQTNTQEQLLCVLQSEESEEKTQKIDSKEANQHSGHNKEDGTNHHELNNQWKLLEPMTINDFEMFLYSVMTQQNLNGTAQIIESGHQIEAI